jgi:hypothetical protein
MLDRQNSSFAQLRSAVNCARRWRAIEICQLPGAVTVPKSRIFGATVGCSVPAASFSKHDYLIDPSRFASKGNWASNLFKDATLTHLALDADRVASGWQICWRTANFSVSAKIWVERSRILKCWETPDASAGAQSFQHHPARLKWPWRYREWQHEVQAPRAWACRVL